MVRTGLRTMDDIVHTKCVKKVRETARFAVTSHVTGSVTAISVALVPLWSVFTTQWRRYHSSL